MTDSSSASVTPINEALEVAKTITAFKARCHNKTASAVCSVIGETITNPVSRADFEPELSPELWAHLAANELRCYAGQIMTDAIGLVIKAQQGKPAPSKENFAKLGIRLEGFLFVSMTAKPAVEFQAIRMAVVAAAEDLRIYVAPTLSD